jgi:hypothetical protein
MRLTTGVMFCVCVRFNIFSAVSAHCTRGHENYSRWLWGRTGISGRRYWSTLARAWMKLKGTQGDFAGRQTQLSRSLVRTPGITGVVREISTSGTQFRDCDYIKGVRRRSMIISFQRRSPIVGKKDLGIISRWKQWWHGLINTEHHLL